jgi:DNA ligase-1
MSSMRPMLACNDTVLTDRNYDRITYPVFASTKLDGRRNVVNAAGTPLSRTGKLLPNLHTRKIIHGAKLIGMDGELICGSPTDPNAMQKAHSAFSSVHGEPDFSFHIFDNWTRARTSYRDYWPELEAARAKLPEWATIVPQLMIVSPEDLDDFVKQVTKEGYEGAVVRALHSPYKHGRSTWKQGWMLKAKEYEYTEGKIVALKQAMHNVNDAEYDELGFIRRSSHASGKLPAGTLGSFIVQHPSSKETFGVATGGLTAAEKRLLWDMREEYNSCVGLIITFKHFAQSGVRNKPRHAQFIAFRDATDMIAA